MPIARIAILKNGEKFFQKTWFLRIHQLFRIIIMYKVYYRTTVFTGINILC